MRKKLLIASAALAVLIVAFLGFVALQPPDYRVERTAAMAAPVSTVFAQVNDLHNWEGWSPWAKLDPAAKNTFEGPSAGTGAIFRWSGNDEIGEGSMTVIDSRPEELVRIKLEFIRPFEDTCTTEFAFQPQGDHTHVTWTMAGHKNFLAKLVCLFMDMDAVLGGEFEQGLANMKSLVEKPPAGAE